MTGERNLKKSNGYIHEVNLYSKILFIENESNEYPTRMLLRVMEVAPSTYYKELKHTPSQRELENERIDKAILSIYTWPLPDRARAGRAPAPTGTRQYMNAADAPAVEIAAYTRSFPAYIVYFTRCGRIRQSLLHFQK